MPIGVPLCGSRGVERSRMTPPARSRKCYAGPKGQRPQRVPPTGAPNGGSVVSAAARTEPQAHDDNGTQRAPAAAPTRGARPGCMIAAQRRNAARPYAARDEPR